MWKYVRCYTCRDICIPPVCINSVGIPMAPNNTVGSWACVCHPLNPGPDRLLVFVVVDDDDPVVVVAKRGTF